ncbi:MAG: thiamine-binding protein [Acidimicrobiia bacterium]|nr:thiamine-binding protein [Acidimicrobiia bacterium]
MDVSAQFAIYPLGQTGIGPAISAAVAAVRGHGLDPDVGSMSTLVVGPSATVFAVLHDAFVAAATGGCVLVATVSNACPLPDRSRTADDG